MFTSFQHYYIAASSSLESISCGVLIVIKHNLNLTITDSYGSPDGCITYIKANFSGRNYVLFSIYAPNHFDPTFYGKLTETLSEMQEHAVIISADMNAILDATIDSASLRNQHSQKMSTEAFKNLLLDFTLQDLYCLFFPNSRPYTFFKQTQNIFKNKIFTCYTSAYLKMQKIEIIPATLSDHLMVISKSTLNNIPIRATQWRLNTTVLTNKEYCEYIRSELINSYL